jgi:hypothetical protein
MSRRLVQISFCVDPDTLQAINDHIKGKSQNERIRLCVEEGFKVLKR